MKCPLDGTSLTMSERSGIEIDYCPECRGVWLDRGELDKILERAGGHATPPPAPRQADYQQSSGYQQQPRRKKKEHWLMEIFD